jgi:hypothetical protein
MLHLDSDHDSAGMSGDKPISGKSLDRAAIRPFYQGPRLLKVAPARRLFSGLNSRAKSASGRLDIRS